jgi:hypothetical protein
MTPARLQVLLRRGTLLLAAVGAAYLWTRFEVLPLPAGGCSPLRRLRPGTLLWVDRRPGPLEVGDVVFFRLADGTIVLGEVARREASPPRSWVLTDDPACPGTDSDDLGWVPDGDVHGRLMMAFDLGS